MSWFGKRLPLDLRECWPRPGELLEGEWGRGPRRSEAGPRGRLLRDHGDTPTFQSVPALAFRRGRGIIDTSLFAGEGILIPPPDGVGGHLRGVPS
jgi:hypothetical protein